MYLKDRIHKSGPFLRVNDENDKNMIKFNDTLLPTVADHVRYICPWLSSLCSGGIGKIVKIIVSKSCRSSAESINYPEEINYSIRTKKCNHQT